MDDTTRQTVIGCWGGRWFVTVLDRNVTVARLQFGSELAACAWVMRGAYVHAGRADCPDVIVSMGEPLAGGAV